MNKVIYRYIYLFNTINMNITLIIIFISTLYIIYKSWYIILSIYYMYMNNIYIDGFVSYIYMYKEIFIDKCYDIDINDNMVIFDVGANIGLFTNYINSLNKNVKVYSFEPVVETFNKLKLNSKGENNILINKALGNANEISSINYIDNASSLSSINEFSIDKLEAHNEIYNKYGIFKGIIKYFLEKEFNNSQKKQIEITTISTIIDEYNIETIDILKIDVEGFELNVLKGIHLQDFYKIKNIFIEIENFRKENRDNIYNILVSNGFKIQELEKGNWLMIKAINMNHI